MIWGTLSNLRSEARFGAVCRCSYKLESRDEDFPSRWSRVIWGEEFCVGGRKLTGELELDLGGAEIDRDGCGVEMGEGEVCS